MKEPTDNLIDKSKRIAKYLYKQYNIEEKRGEGCGKLLSEWIKENYWGIIVSKHIPIFKKVWEILDRKKYTKNNKFIYGDIDVGLWIEYPKNKDKKVIVSTRYCSCADDNTHIFMLEDRYRTRFRVATVWEKENNKGGYRVKKSTKYPNGWFSWGDDRDIKIPSLNTYRKRDFHYGYYDCRDKGHCFLYENYSFPEKKLIGRVEHAHWGEDKIEHALWTLRGHLEALKEEK